MASTKRDVDPIGACVGLRGTRIQVISRELRGEKIDIIEWSHDPATFVARALSPAKVSSVTIGDEGEAEGQPSAFVAVPDNQLSLAIGKKGQNARLAAKLTGMRIDIKSESELEAEKAGATQEPDRPPWPSWPGWTPEMVEALVAAGLSSPRAIVRAGRERLAGIAAVGERAEAVLRGGSPVGGRAGSRDGSGRGGELRGRGLGVKRPSEGSGEGPRRTCIGCRQVRAQTAVVRLGPAVGRHRGPRPPRSWARCVRVSRSRLSGAGGEATRAGVQETQRGRHRPG